MSREALGTIMASVNPLIGEFMQPIRDLYENIQETFGQMGTAGVHIAIIYVGVVHILPSLAYRTLTGAGSIVGNMLWPSAGPLSANPMQGIGKLPIVYLDQDRNEIEKYTFDHTILILNGVGAGPIQGILDTLCLRIADSIIAAPIAAGSRFLRVVATISGAVSGAVAYDSSKFFKNDTPFGTFSSSSSQSSSSRSSPPGSPQRALSYGSQESDLSVSSVGSSPDMFSNPSAAIRLLTPVCSVLSSLFEGDWFNIVAQRSSNQAVPVLELCAALESVPCLGGGASSASSCASIQSSVTGTVRILGLQNSTSSREIVEVGNKIVQAARENRRIIDPGSALAAIQGYGSGSDYESDPELGGRKSRKHRRKARKTKKAKKVKKTKKAKKVKKVFVLKGGKKSKRSRR